VSHAIEFIEPLMFIRQIKQIATDEELSELQKKLIESPEKKALSSRKLVGYAKSGWRRAT